MNEKSQILLILFLNFLTTSTQATNCNKSCGGRILPYPFGFSDGCQIRLNCSNNQIQINNFPVIDFNSDFIRISVEPKCDRPISALRDLYGESYAPSSRNAILLHGCSGKAEPCAIPTINVTTSFEMVNCSSNKKSINCYSKYPIEKYGFVDYGNLSKNTTHCQYFLSSISAESLDSGMSLDVRIAELGWWINGENCDQCAKKAFCMNITKPDGNSGYRCNCKEGFHGDGYRAGDGCRKGDLDCTATKFITGKCGRQARVAALVGGIAIGSSLIIGICLLCYIMKRRSTTKKSKYLSLSKARSFNISIPIYAYKEIEKATNNFSEKQRLGTGAYGTVYAGKLQKDVWVAVKRIKHRDTDSIEQVMNEIKLISSVSHPNLVRLLGCSIDNAEQVLVYEFMPNGTLSEHLQREKGDGIPWAIRLNIAHETAQAIAHLHFSIEPPIYHRDVKSSNILLDFNFRSKLADFGLSRLGKTEISHISTAPQGTPGYVDPEYHQNFHLSDKSDVYSFGVVLVEIITGLKAVDFLRAPSEVNLAALANDRISKGQLEDIIDPFIEPHCDAWTSSSIHKVAELAFRCLSFHRDMRPTMKEVAEEIAQIRGGAEEIGYVGSSEGGSGSTCSSNVSEKPLSKSKRKEREVFGVKMSIGSVLSMERNSPISVQDSWMSETSSPSSSSLLSNVMMR